MIKIVLSIFGLLLISANLNAQNDYPYPSLSPKGSIIQLVGNTTVKIEYERPAARQRKIFGELVPWNKVWRTGAGYCTKISFDKDIRIGGQPIQKGKYSLFTIPKPDEWIIILNKDTSLYGSYYYSQEHDITRFKVIPDKTDRYYESLNFDIELIPNNARVYLSWENTRISFDIQTTTDDLIEQFIRSELLTGKEDNSDIYAGAAEYHLYQGTDLSRGIALADKALEINKSNGWAKDLKIRIYEKMEFYEEAIRVIESLIKELEDVENEKERKDEIRSLKERLQSIKSKMDK